MPDTDTDTGELEIGDWRLVWWRGQGQVYWKNSTWLGILHTRPSYKLSFQLLQHWQLLLWQPKFLTEPYSTVIFETLFVVDTRFFERMKVVRANRYLVNWGNENEGNKNWREVQNKGLHPLGDRGRADRDFPLLWSAKIPVIDARVERPKGGILCPLSMFDGNSDLGCLCVLELRIEEPDLFDLNSGLMEVSADLITACLSQSRVTLNWKKELCDLGGTPLRPGPGDCPLLATLSFPRNSPLLHFDRAPQLYRRNLEEEEEEEEEVEEKPTDYQKTEEEEEQSLKYHLFQQPRQDGCFTGNQWWWIRDWRRRRRRRRELTMIVNSRRDDCSYSCLALTRLEEEEDEEPTLLLLSRKYLPEVTTLLSLL